MFKPLVAGSFCLTFAAGATAAPQGIVQFDNIEFDNWLTYQQNNNDSSQLQYDPRLFIPFKLSPGWTFMQRIDVPALYTDEVGTDNPTGGWKGGIGDAFIEEILASPELAKNFSMWASVRLVFPTGGSSPFGSDQYQWAPALSAKYVIPEHGIMFNPVARYFMSYHATEAGARKVRQLDLFPILTFALPHNWSVAAYSENGISYNDVTNKWFVPIDLMLIKRVTKTVELGLGGAYGLVKDDAGYKYNIYARITVYF
jgi:hypothetical protein